MTPLYHAFGVDGKLLVELGGTDEARVWGRLRQGADLIRGKVPTQRQLRAMGYSVKRTGGIALPA